MYVMDMAYSTVQVRTICWVLLVLNGVGCMSSNSREHNRELCFDEYCLKYEHNSKTLNTAQARCQSRGGHLVVVDTSLKQQRLEHLLNANDASSVWIGATVSISDSSECAAHSNEASDIEYESCWNEHNFACITRGTSVCPHNFSPCAGHCVHTPGHKMNWVHASQLCMYMGSHLISSGSVLMSCHVPSPTWLADNAPTQLEWNDGSTGKLTMWHNNEPGDDMCVIVVEEDTPWGIMWGWKTKSCNERRSYVCQNDNIQTTASHPGPPRPHPKPRRTTSEMWTTSMQTASSGGDGPVDTNGGGDGGHRGTDAPPKPTPEHRDDDDNDDTLLLAVYIAVPTFSLVFFVSSVLCFVAARRRGRLVKQQAALLRSQSSTTTSTVSSLRYTPPPPPPPPGEQYQNLDSSSTELRHPYTTLHAPPLPPPRPEEGHVYEDLPDVANQQSSNNQISANNGTSTNQIRDDISVSYVSVNDRADGGGDGYSYVDPHPNRSLPHDTYSYVNPSLMNNSPRPDTSSAATTPNYIEILPQL